MNVQRSKSTRPCNEKQTLLIKGRLPEIACDLFGRHEQYFQLLVHYNIAYRNADLKDSQQIKTDKPHFVLAEIKNLPEKLNNPVMVFKSKTVDGSVVVLNELSNGKSNFVAAIELGKILLSGIKIKAECTQSGVFIQKTL